MKFEFDAARLRIRMPDIDPGSSGTIEIDVQRDLYTAWKDWCLQGNIGFAPQAFEPIGGHRLPNGKRIESAFLLLNRWRIQLAPGNYRLRINGNLQSDDGESPFKIPEGSNISIIGDEPKEEIIGLKPSFFGFSLDLKAAWRRWRQ